MKVPECWDKQLRFKRNYRRRQAGHEKLKFGKKTGGRINEAISQKCAQQPCAKGADEERNQFGKGRDMALLLWALLGDRSLFPHL